MHGSPRREVWEPLSTGSESLLKTVSLNREIFRANPQIKKIGGHTHRRKREKALDADSEFMSSFSQYPHIQ